MRDPSSIDGPCPAQGPVGIVGAGQLARMTCEAASALGIAVVVLAESETDAAVATAAEVMVGRPSDAEAVRALARRCSVITFDHEQVDLELLESIEKEGVPVRPDPATLRVAVDKEVMRHHLADAGIPVPAFASLGKAGERTGPPDDLVAEVEAFARCHGWPVVLKAVRGGYDGKGVWPVDDLAAAREVCTRAVGSGVQLLVEAQVPLDAELAVLVVRRPGGEAATWPAVQTVQVDGVCREILLPGCVDPALAARAESLAREVAAVVGSTGVLAVELFLADGRLLVNEIAARPHNSGHWTIEGAVTSQFENHLRGVLDLPLGSTAPVAATVACINVLGGPLGKTPGASLAGGLAVGGAHVHLYGKEAQPGRKLGHVTVCGKDPVDVRARAWTAARALGTPVPDDGVPLAGDVPAHSPRNVPQPPRVQREPAR